MNITLKGCTKDNCYSTTNVSISNTSYNNISLVVQFPSNKTLDTNAILYYQNGFTVQSNTITISTHDLQEFTLINITSNSACLQFQYVSGSTPYIDVILLADDVDYIIDGFNISPNDQLNFIQCITNIPAGNNLTLYACEWATIYTCQSNSPAVITGINITNDSTSSVLMSSVHSSSVSLTSTVLTTPSMMSVPLSTSPAVTTSSVPTTSSSTSITSSMTSLPTKISTLVVPIPSIMSEFETFPSSVLTTVTTLTVPQVTSSTIISSTTDTRTITTSESTATSPLPSSITLPFLTSSSSSLSSSSITSQTSSFVTSSSTPTPSSTARSFITFSFIILPSFIASSSIIIPTFSISSSSSIIGLASGASIALIIIIIGASISFTIVPETQYVYVNDTVTFECAINVPQTFPFFVTYPSVDGSESSYPGMASLHLIATSEVNGTEVTCKAPNGATTEPAYLYVQGPPESVSNLTGYQLDSCCMFISWYPPFTLPGLTVQYIISVGTDQHYLNDSITNYTYCPMNQTNKQYLFNITTTNKAGNGSTSNITVGFQSTSK
uniref:Fibronectin type-III domain-containing protein n=1 Tax=Amphimedon queenslandica TaxID=400682 RepID=A0A1X7SXU0_AMPQE